MPVAAVAAVNEGSASSTSGLGSLDADDFLNLLIAEMRNQDPMDPMDTGAMVQQLSQMNMVAETRQLREGQEFAQAVGLLGRTVSWQSPTTGQVATGVVGGVARDGSTATVVVDGQRLKLSVIMAIS